MIIPVKLGERSYDVVIEKGIFNSAEKELKLKRKVLIVTDDGVPFEYAKRISRKCEKSWISVIKSGENHKNLRTMEKLFALMLEKGFTRKDCVVAVGGGIVGDLAGFTAASYMRGIDFYNIPTTVLSCVDSSVGGKTAVNFGGVKNIIGAFWQPKKVLIDVELLHSLPERQISNGLAEAVKMALTFDKDFFEVFRKFDVEKAGLSTDDDFLQEVIARSVQLKADVVEKDEKEAGLRKVLNFGHTIGHGIELCSRGRLYHGECVALGMLCMSSEEVRGELLPILKKLKLPVSCRVNYKKALECVSHDKKGSGSTISCVLVKEAGTFELKDMTLEEIGQRMQQVLD